MKAVQKPSETSTGFASILVAPKVKGKSKGMETIGFLFMGFPI
jgi:hypothetical protein